MVAVVAQVADVNQERKSHQTRRANEVEKKHRLATNEQAREENNEGEDKDDLEYVSGGDAIRILLFQKRNRTLGNGT